jgi:hypothetical protein
MSACSHDHFETFTTTIIPNYITYLQILKLKLLPVQQVQGIFLLYKTSTLALEPTEPPIQWL